MKHLVDHRRTTNAGRILHFTAIARKMRATWHRAESAAGNTRVVHFCRIARGRLV